MRLRRVRDRAVERRPARAEPERGDHQPGVAEHLLGLDETLALDAADEPVGVDVDVVEEQRGGVAQPDAVLVLGLAVREARRRRDSTTNQHGPPGAMARIV